MKTKAVRMYGTRDLRLEEFELPEIKEDEILVKVMSDSICMSAYRLAEQGETDLLFRKLDEACQKNRGLWNAEAEKILFEHYGVL